MLLLPGDVGFSTIEGPLGTMVNAGQSLLRDSCRYTHVFVYLDNGTVLEAMPQGARAVRGYDRPGPWYRLPLTDLQRTLVVDSYDLRGTPYSFMDYAALATYQWRLPLRNILRKYVSTSKRMICSQLVDFVLCRAGYHVFNDGRMHQDVTPGDLFYACAEQGALIKDKGVDIR